MSPDEAREYGLIDRIIEPGEERKGKDGKGAPSGEAGTELRAESSHTEEEAATEDGTEV